MANEVFSQIPLDRTYPLVLTTIVIYTDRNSLSLSLPSCRPRSSFYHLN